MKQSIRHKYLKAEGKTKDLEDVFIKKQGFSLDLVVRITIRNFFEGRRFL